MSDQETEELVHDGVCPVCGEEFGDGFGDIEEGESIDDARICVIEKDSEGEMADGIIHLPGEVSS